MPNRFSGNSLNEAFRFPLSGIFHAVPSRMKKSIPFVLAALACVATATAQTVEFEFTPAANTAGPNGSDFSTPSYISFSPATGSFDYPAHIVLASQVGGSPTTGTDYVVSWDINTPEGELDSANSYFDNFYEQSAAWTPTGISAMNLTVFGGNESIDVNFTPTGISSQDPFTINGSWSAVPDAASTFGMLALAAGGLLAAPALKRSPRLARVSA